MEQITNTHTITDFYFLVNTIKMIYNVANNSL